VDDQAEKLADSTPSEKIGSMIGVGEGPSVAVCVGVAEAVGVSDGVLVGVNEGTDDAVALMVGVTDGALVEVNEATGDEVTLAVGVKLEAAVGVRVGVLVKVLADSVFVATGVDVEAFVVTMS
jgi:hypothetical protein